MNQRDRLFVARELEAWANWIRQGMTEPNALGYRSSTVEYSIMRGTVGGCGISTSTVPEKFNIDKNVEKVSKIFAGLPEDQKIVLMGVYLYRMPERRISLIVGESKHRILLWLYAGQEAVFAGLTAKQE